MAIYQDNGSIILRKLDGAFIPKDFNNHEYREYLAWVALGNTPDPMPAYVKTPDEVDADAVRAYPKLHALATLTPAQVATWVDANINTLADAKDALKTLAMAVGILARRI